jgi:hypothetical protein
MDSTTIAQMILKGLPNADVTVTGDDGVHFEAVVRCAEFAGNPTLARHRWGTKFTHWACVRSCRRTSACCSADCLPVQFEWAA